MTDPGFKASLASGSTLWPTAMCRVHTHRNVSIRKSSENLTPKHPEKSFQMVSDDAEHILLLFDLQNILEKSSIYFYR